MKIFFSPEAEDDFAGAVSFLAIRNPAAAAELGRRVFGIIDRLARRELEGPEQTLQTGELVRAWPVPPVRVYYRRHDDALWILRVYHQARPPITR
ncbi:MAG TPA: type II toxin-antitoxin system RelE/ParE family toxin [Kofleriaceae bacterium]|nr:type II toxin-antitoxin system RelE/ParE family toxin [Kofleriaceae bacterium]